MARDLGGILASDPEIPTVPTIRDYGYQSQAHGLLALYALEIVE